MIQVFEGDGIDRSQHVGSGYVIYTDPWGLENMRSYVFTEPRIGWTRILRLAQRFSTIDEAKACAKAHCSARETLRYLFVWLDEV